MGELTQIGRPRKAGASRHPLAAFEMRKLTPTEWVILDVSLGENDPARTVACIYEADTDRFDVIWLRDLGLRAGFASPEDVLEAVVRANRVRPHPRASRPVPIPRRAPLDRIIA